MAPVLTNERLSQIAALLERSYWTKSELADVRQAARDLREIAADEPRYQHIRRVLQEMYISDGESAKAFSEAAEILFGKHTHDPEQMAFIPGCPACESEKAAAEPTRKPNFRDLLSTDRVEHDQQGLRMLAPDGSLLAALDWTELSRVIVWLQEQVSKRPAENRGAPRNE